MTNPYGRPLLGTTKAIPGAGRSLASSRRLGGGSIPVADRSLLGGGNAKLDTSVRIPKLPQAPKRPPDPNRDAKRNWFRQVVYTDKLGQGATKRLFNLLNAAGENPPRWWNRNDYEAFRNLSKRISEQVKGQNDPTSWKLKLTGEEYMLLRDLEMMSGQKVLNDVGTPPPQGLFNRTDYILPNSQERLTKIQEAIAAAGGGVEGLRQGLIEMGLKLP